MAEKQTAASGAAVKVDAEKHDSLLEKAVAATRQTKQDEVEDLLQALTSEALKDTKFFDKNVTRSIKRAISRIDAEVSKQLAAVMHHEKFRKLEGSWRGLNYLVKNSRSDLGVNVRVLNASKRDILKDFEKASEFDQSQIFKKIYEAEFGTPNGAPYAALIGDYEIENHPDDMEFLRGMAGVSAAAFAPFITAASANFFGFNDFRELSNPTDLKTHFDTKAYMKWRSFRETEDSEIRYTYDASRIGQVAIWSGHQAD